VASGKGGVGKTLISVNLALAFQRLGKRVLLVDADLGLANADIVLGVHPEHTLEDALFRGLELEQVVADSPYGVHLLAASSGARHMLALGEPRMRMFIDQLVEFAGRYDVLLFDCAAGINASVTAFIAAAPQTLLVATPQPTSLMDVYALMKVMHQGHLADRAGIVFNMLDDADRADHILQRLQDLSDTYLGLRLEYLGTVPRSDAVGRAIHARQPLLAYAEDDPASRRIADIAKAVLRRQTGSVRLGNLDARGLVRGILER
jgi:flagellar biosynthesis protein FlhG